MLTARKSLCFSTRPKPRIRQKCAQLERISNAEFSPADLFVLEARHSVMRSVIELVAGFRLFKHGFLTLSRKHRELERRVERYG